MALEHRISELDTYLFAKGTHYEIYEKMGAHLAEEDGKAGTYFSVWAPNARSVSVVGDFNNWDRSAHPMQPVQQSGIWDIFVPGVKAGDLYKFAVETSQGYTVLKADPYGNQSQLRPDNASVVADIRHFDWTDQAWRKAHQEKKTESPMAIYEVHPGSWKKDPSMPGEFYNFKKLAVELADYVLEMGYTHVELIGLSEHPFDGSWGYQVSGYYAPTARYGTPADFMYFVNYMHDHGIGVILDWVPAHFPKDEFGLGRFDGTALYEHQDPRKGEHPEWGTYCFNYGRTEVSNFLVANALFWIEKFHVDGLRVDAVASMLYLDFGRSSGNWIPNEDGGNQNYEAITFLKHLNSIVAQRNPGAMMIAEESTAWPKVTGDVDDGGLGFTYKWNMGWMHDFLEYMKCDPIFRKYHQNQITFSFMYAYSENYVLVLSHDEVVHLKKSMIYKMPGTMPEKFGNLRAAYGLMMMHPGKKLLFMGQDFAQTAEWNEAKSLDWHLLEKYPEHQQLNHYYCDLLHFYQNEPALYELDDSPEGFAWINGSDAEHNMLTFCRMTKDKKNCLLCHFNFSPVAYENFQSGVLCPGTYTEVFNSNAAEYGGTGLVNSEPIEAVKESWDFKDYSIKYHLGAYGVCIFKFDYVEPKPEEPQKPARRYTKEDIHKLAGHYKKIK
ncbi:1,4-alpha-glucan branching protein GlgB [Coprococcus catus]|jgi:1,4-alpha-glucan branching enzyme|uniref:1,4-alpha-glucan branching enzyme GlgB n=2 Tax=Coprococcus catus TaxID=116085 RepID=A0A3E2TRA1_9FIRM|nr:1,4-alpha-glucan branching protein GlgB [Coprococcus catus]RGB81277.1 1,4-alpha-glucan branching protein GlgB [Coprococcus catus]CBK80008.1 alpha-1,4-glucan:alpha-1,4-glucan 6-glycosyltransferase [Coprococcus catus GD/7]